MFKQLQFWFRTVVELDAGSKLVSCVLLQQAQNLTTPARPGFSRRSFSLKQQGLLRTRVSGFSSQCYNTWEPAFVQLRHLSTFRSSEGIIFSIRESFSYKMSGLSSLGISVWKRDPCWDLKAPRSFSLEPVFPSVQRSSHLNSRRIQLFEIQNVQCETFSSAVDILGSPSYLTP